MFNYLQAYWQSAHTLNEPEYAKHRKIIDKDVSRTDRTHVFFQGEDNPNLDRLRNILLCHIMLDKELGYIQGMNDFASPLLRIFDSNIVDAFWCFAHYMKKRRHNFIEITMHNDLVLLKSLVHYLDPVLSLNLQSAAPGLTENWLFCHRWLLLDLKREFSLDLVPCLWEV